MSFTCPNNVLETSTTQGTGTLTLAGAVANFATFASQMSGGDTTIYCISDSVNREIGYGTLGGAGPYTLTRDTVIFSTNGGAKVNWGAGTRNVACVLPGEAVKSWLDPAQAVGVLTRTALNTYGVLPAPQSDHQSGSLALTASFQALASKAVTIPATTSLYVVVGMAQVTWSATIVETKLTVDGGTVTPPGVPSLGAVSGASVEFPTLIGIGTGLSAASHTFALEAREAAGSSGTAALRSVVVLVL